MNLDAAPVPAVSNKALSETADQDLPDPKLHATKRDAMFASRYRSILVLLPALLLSACALQPPVCNDSAPAHVIAARPALLQAAVTAHPLATAAALTMLDRGGAAVDAAIAAQMVLGLVEPQSSGVGGGSLIMHWDAGSGKLASYDGLSAAPARVTAALTIDVDGSALKSDDVQRGGRSIGVPGTLAALKLAHERHGRLDWDKLFLPAIELAESGFPLPPYMHTILSSPTAAADHADLLPLYFGRDGKVLPVGTRVINLAYAASMRQIAARGPAQWWRDGAARELVAAGQRGARPTLITEADVRGYRAETRDPLCAPFLVYSVCVMAPPSFGGVVVLQLLQMLEARPWPEGAPRRFDFDDPAFVHYYAEAGRLAQADRLSYVGDPGFVPVPADALVAAAYVRERAGLIDGSRMSPEVGAGTPLRKAASSMPYAPLESVAADATSQLAVTDRLGNALSMTTTNNLNFGSRLLFNGVVLNNALTNFSAAPRAGQAAPNRMQGGKRPVTSMAPLIVFDRAGKPVVVGGSAGGGQIVDYISASLVEMLANQRSPAEALARGHVSTAVRGRVQLERGTSAASQAAALTVLGHTVEVIPMVSGLGFLMRRDGGWLGAADPRRDGVAEGR